MGARSTGAPSSWLISTPWRVTTATSSSSRITTSRVCERMAGMGRSRHQRAPAVVVPSGGGRQPDVICRTRTLAAPRADGTEPEPGLPARFLRERGTRSTATSHRVRHASTYRDIRAYIYARHGFSPRTGWIAHVKELNGLTLRPTHNRHGSTRVDPCPPERRAAIEEVLRHFGIL